RGDVLHRLVVQGATEKTLELGRRGVFAQRSPFQLSQKIITQPEGEPPLASCKRRRAGGSAVSDGCRPSGRAAAEGAPARSPKRAAGRRRGRRTKRRRSDPGRSRASAWSAAGSPPSSPGAASPSR